MAIATGTAIALGALALAGGTAATIAGQAGARKSAKKSANVQRDALEAEKIAAQQAAAAPGEAAEKAKEDTLNRRRGRAKTLLTSATGVASPGTLLRQTLGGK